MPELFPMARLEWKTHGSSSDAGNRTQISAYILMTQVNQEGWSGNTSTFNSLWLLPK